MSAVGAAGAAWAVGPLAWGAWFGRGRRGRRRVGATRGRAARRIHRGDGGGRRRRRDVDLFDAGQGILQGRSQLAAVLGDPAGHGVDIHLQPLAGDLQLGQFRPHLDQGVLVASPGPLLGLADQALGPVLGLRQGRLGPAFGLADHGVHPLLGVAEEGLGLLLGAPATIRAACSRASWTARSAVRWASRRVRRRASSLPPASVAACSARWARSMAWRSRSWRTSMPAATRSRNWSTSSGW